MYVVPAAGLSVRDPDRMDRLPPEGRAVPETDYWRRRIAERSVVVTAPPPAPSPERVEGLPHAVPASDHDERE